MMDRYFFLVCFVWPLFQRLQKMGKQVEFHNEFCKAYIPFFIFQFAHKESQEWIIQFAVDGHTNKEKVVSFSRLWIVKIMINFLHHLYSFHLLNAL